MNDIAKHEFADSIAGIKVDTEIDTETLILKINGGWIFFDKDDVIAMAKHFKLTENDLK